MPTRRGLGVLLLATGLAVLGGCGADQPAVTSADPSSVTASSKPTPSAAAPSTNAATPAPTRIPTPTPTPAQTPPPSTAAPTPATQAAPRPPTPAPPAPPPPPAVPAPAPAPLPAYQASAVPIDPALTQRMSSSWRPGCPVPLADLRYVRVSYVDFGGAPQTGELVVHVDATSAVIEAFRVLYEQRFPIRSLRLVDDFGGSDDASMAADNTSGFNCRAVTGGSGWSRHAYGRAIDLNPVENPYVRGGTVLPPAGRDLPRPFTRPTRDGRGRRGQRVRGRRLGVGRALLLRAGLSTLQRAMGADPAGHNRTGRQSGCPGRRSAYQTGSGQLVDQPGVDTGHRVGRRHQASAHPRSTGRGEQPDGQPPRPPNHRPPGRLVVLRATERQTARGGFCGGPADRQPLPGQRIDVAGRVTDQQHASGHPARRALGQRPGTAHLATRGTGHSIAQGRERLQPGVVADPGRRGQDRDPDLAWRRPGSRTPRPTPPSAPRRSPTTARRRSACAGPTASATTSAGRGRGCDGSASAGRRPRPASAHATTPARTARSSWTTPSTRPSTPTHTGGVCPRRQRVVQRRPTDAAAGAVGESRGRPAGRRRRR